MANNLNSNPINLTATQTSYKAAVATSQGSPFTLLLKSVYWEQPNAVGDGFLLIDPNGGREILRGRCEVAGQSQLFPLNMMVSDWACDQLDSGNLKIYTI